MRVFLLVLFFVGIILIQNGYYNNKIFTPKQKLKYVFVDKNIEETLYEDQMASKHFDKMFNADNI